MTLMKNKDLYKILEIDTDIDRFLKNTTHKMSRYVQNAEEQSKLTLLRGLESVLYNIELQKMLYQGKCFKIFL